MRVIRMPRARLLLPGLAAAGAAAAAHAQSPSRADTLQLDLRRSIEIAITNSTPVQLGADTVSLAGIALMESYGRFLPNVTTAVGTFGQSGYSLLTTTALIPTSASFYGMTYQLTASVNLFNGFRDREHMRASLSARDAATRGLDRAKQQVAFDVAQAFYQVVLDRRLAAVAHANLALSAARDSQIEEQVRVGTRAPPDLYRQQAQEKADEVALIDADDRTTTDIASLLNRLRLDATRPYTVVEPAPDTTRLASGETQLAPLTASAIARRPDLAAAESKQTADEHDRQLARGELLPQLNLRFDYIGAGRIFGREVTGGQSVLTTSQRSFFDQLGDQRYAQMSLGVSWSLFDGYRERFDMERSLVATNRDRLNIEDLRLRIASELQTALNSYHAAEQKLIATAVGLDAAQESFDAAQGRYEVGLASVVDVLTAQTALTQARALREEAIANIALQKAVLRFASGELPVP
jgi:outer membrane protein